MYLGEMPIRTELEPTRPPFNGLAPSYSSTTRAKLNVTLYNLNAMCLPTIFSIELMLSQMNNAKYMCHLKILYSITDKPPHQG